MKQRRTVIVCFLLVAAMMLGIGYAAVATDTLEITGLIAVNKEAVLEQLEADVYFTKAELAQDGNPAGLTASCSIANSEKPDVAYLTLNGFTSEGQSVKYVYTMKNASEEKAVLATLNVSNGAGEGYFAITTNWGPGNTKTIAADTEQTSEVTVTLNAIPNDALTVTDFALTITAEYTE